MGPFFIVIVAVMLLILISAIKVFREYERGVVFMLGRFWQVKGPGLVLIIPIIQQVVRVDLRTMFPGSAALHPGYDPC